ncbi:MAG: hypothetical protein IJX49_01680 [Clostridia bacterium]|nr:hypothetical protein [Clostridia bacterium]
MFERTLNDRFIELEDRMISVEALTRYGTANDLKFYIFDYAPKDELIVRKEVKKLFVLTTYQTIGSGKNIQYSIPQSQENRVLFALEDTRRTKDFEGIYLSTPTNLLQLLTNDSEDRYRDLAKYLFHQEYLHQNKLLTYSQMKYNIANGFRKVFFGEQPAYYHRNGDLYANTLKIAIQAAGRICRCRNKNKNIYIYADREMVERVQIACGQKYPQLLNEEFKALLNMELMQVSNEKLQIYSKQSKKAYTTITHAAFTLRRSIGDIHEWQKLRDFVLKNPTTDNPGKYKEFYFEFDEKYSGYSYKQNNCYDIIDIRMDTRYDMNQVSEEACDLPILLSFNSIEKMFKERGYARRFKKARYIMSPSLFKQVYLGALGEVVGKQILEEELGWDLEELDEVSFYEYFDYKLGNIYFDFKHWVQFRIDNNAYVQKVQGKLQRMNGAKCFVINLIKRINAEPKINMGETVVQIPYLIDGETGCINSEAIEYIGTLYDG